MLNSLITQITYPLSYYGISISIDILEHTASIHCQGSFCVCTQLMTASVTVQPHLSLARRIHRMTPALHARHHSWTGSPFGVRYGNILWVHGVNCGANIPEEIKRGMSRTHCLLWKSWLNYNAIVDPLTFYMNSDVYYQRGNIYMNIYPLECKG